MSLGKLHGKTQMEGELYLSHLFFCNKFYLKYETNVWFVLTGYLFVYLFVSNREATVAKSSQILGLHPRARDGDARDYYSRTYILPALHSALQITGQGGLIQGPGSHRWSLLGGSPWVHNQEQISLTSAIPTGSQVDLHAYDTGPGAARTSHLQLLLSRALEPKGPFNSLLPFVVHPSSLSQIWSLGSIPCPRGWAWREC